mgnify:CR=1 FL=1
MATTMATDALKKRFETEGFEVREDVVAVALALGFYRWSKRNTINVPPCSVPEILHALAHGDCTVRALAGRALRSIIFGEVDVLEDLLDDVAGKHADDFGKKREDGRTLLDIAVEDASNGDADAITLLLAVTELDDAWDVAEDEWNLLVQRARGEVTVSYTHLTLPTNREV